jgi:predicted nucleotide-binding protein
MSSHLLLAIEDEMLQTSDLEMLYEVASHEFADAMTDLRRGTPERSVFVVHGHDQKSLQKLAAFVEKRGCVPQILSRLPHQGSETIIESLERALPMAGLVVALFTEDDEGRARADSSGALRPRARQNVLVEAGYAIIQRRTDSIIIVLGDVEVPSDFGGILTVRAKEWGFEVEDQLADFIEGRL